MKEKTLKSISKLLVAVMIATIALPSGAFAGHGNYKQDKVMAAEVSMIVNRKQQKKTQRQQSRLKKRARMKVVLRKQELMKHLQQKSHQQLKQQHRHRQQKCQQQKLLQVTLIS